MAFSTIGPTDLIRSTHVTEISGALSGTTGQGQPIKLTALSDTANYALDVKNLDATNAYHLRVQTAAGGTVATFVDSVVTFAKKLAITITDAFTTTANMLAITATWSAAGETFKGILVTITNTNSAAASRLLDLALSTGSKFSVDTSGNTLVAGTLGVTGASTLTGTAYIGDTANANCTLGLTVNQAGNDNEALALKSSDVAHTMTTDAETDTYGTLQKQVATGGLRVTGWATPGVAHTAVNILGVLGQAAQTTHDATQFGVVNLSAAVLSGTTRTAVGADGNLVGINNNGTTRFLFDAEGSAHADVEWIAFDDYDDVALLTDFEQAMVAERDPVKRGFADFLRYNRADLEKAKIVHFSEATPGHAMVNTTRLSMLLVGAIRQVAGRLEEGQRNAERLAALESRLNALEAGRAN